MKHFRTAFVLMICICLMIPAGHVKASDSPMSQLKQTIDQFISVLKDPQYSGEASREKRRNILRDIIHHQFDFITMTKGCLGKYRKNFTSEQIEQIADVNGKIMEYFYINRVEAYTDEKVDFIKEVVKKPDKLVDVFTEITSDNIEPIPITYRMMKKSNGDWKIVNVTVVDINWVNNKRSDWNKILRRASFEEFMAKLNQQLEKIKQTPPAS